jgi:hypothetical protein
MTSRLAVALLLFASAFLVLPVVDARAQPADGAEPEISNLPLGKGAWDLHALDDDPVKLVKASYDKERKVVRFLLEFRRDLTVRDTDWRGVAVRPPFWFRFEDADGVTLLSGEAEFGGQLVGLQGRRVRLILPWPDGPVGALAKKVVVDPRPYGE